MDAYDRCTNLEKKNLADSVTIYDRGREISRPPTYYTLILENIHVYLALLQEFELLTFLVLYIYIYGVLHFHTKCWKKEQQKKI
jgi:hypothetical protein